MKELLSYIVNRIKVAKCKFNVHTFPSGAVMIDVWIDNKFYVIQIEERKVGISIITEKDPGFDTIPQKLFHSSDDFKPEFEKIFTNEFQTESVVDWQNGFKQTLNKTIVLAEKYGLSRMTMDEITAEVKATRGKRKHR